MSKRTDIEIELPGPDMKITVTPPAEPGLPYKAIIRIDWSHVHEVEDNDWTRLVGKLSGWLTEAATSAAKLCAQLIKVQPPAPLVFEEDDVRSVLPAEPAEEVVVAETPGWPEAES